MMKEKKGNFKVMIPVIIAFFMIGIGIALTSFVFDNIKSTQVSNTTEWNTTNAVSEGVGAFGDLMPGAGVVVGVIFLVLVIYVFVNAVGKR